MKLRIIKDTNPLLRKKSIPLDLPLSSNDIELLYEMYNYLKLSQDDDYLKKHPSVKSGVGLAAPQVGVLKRMFVVYVEDKDHTYSYILVNPKIIETSLKYAALECGEGCLSVDKNYDGLVHRHYKIKMQAYNLLTQKEEIISATGFLAIVLQHEYDHLDGILFYDRIDKNNPMAKRNNEVLI